MLERKSTTPSKPCSSPIGNWSGATWVPNDWTSLGTDGFGRSDTRAALRRHFRIDPESIATAVLAELERRGEVPEGTAAQAVERYRLREETVPADKDTEAGTSEVSG